MMNWVELRVHQQSRQRKFLRMLRVKIWLYARSWKRCVRRTQNNGPRFYHVSNYSSGKRSRKVREYCERKARIVCQERFISLNHLMNPVVKVLLKCVIPFSIYFRWYAFRTFCTDISRPLAYGVRISSKASATAGAVFHCHSTHWLISLGVRAWWWEGPVKCSTDPPRWHIHGDPVATQHHGTCHTGKPV